MASGVDDLVIALISLVSIRLVAALSFVELFLRERKSRYLVILLGWLIYAIGPAFGIVRYLETGDSNHPMFGYSAAAGAFLLMFGVYLYHNRISVFRVSGSFLLFILGFGGLLAYFPGMGGLLAVTAQLLMFLLVIVVVVFRRKWVIEVSGKSSYAWLALFLMVGLAHSFGFRFINYNFPISISFLQTMIVNVFLLIFFLHFDREQSIRKQLAGEAIIAASLKEKNVLLREIHHRVKNNMAIIDAMLSLQEPQFHGSEYEEQFRETRNRIRAMSMVHEELYKINDFSSVDLKNYVENLSTHIVKSFGVKIDLKLEIDSFSIEPEVVIPCGLIINEIMSNSFKHAFNGVENKKIEITVKKKSDGMIAMDIADSGTGMPRDVAFDQAKGLGLKLVKNLISQLNGRVEVTGQRGTQYHFEFPEKITFAGIK